MEFESYMLTPALDAALKIIGGLFWTLTYLLIIRRNAVDKTLGMPLVALAANISWEFTFSVLIPHGAPQIYVDWAWLIFDAIIVLQTLRYGPTVFAHTPIGGKRFYPVFVLTLLLSFGAVYTITLEFQDFTGKYAAFSQNLLMSILFLFMLYSRQSLAGQSFYIALFKCLGSLLFSVLFFLRTQQAPYMNYLFLTTLCFDALYVWWVYTKHQALGQNPWTYV